MAFKKKLYTCRPRNEPQATVETRITRTRTRRQRCGPRDLERGVRQMLADKVSGDLAGAWLLVAEHLRLGTWDLLCGWTGQPTERIEPRLALQLVHEAAVCTAGIRAERTLHRRAGFELLNGLPFVATDIAVHEMLAQRSVADCERLQVALGKLRVASGHFQGKLLAVDPHRVVSHSRRHMRKRAEKGEKRPVKMAQTFWILDAQTQQPVCFTTATAARNAAAAAAGLLDLASDILPPVEEGALVLADTEHFAVDLLKDVQQRPGFDLLTPLPNQATFRKQYRAISEDQFHRRWAGFATAKVPYSPKYHEETYWQFVERSGERPEDWQYRGFVCTSDRDEVAALTEEYPQRWRVEEFFNFNQALGWNRGGTTNLNIRYGQMTLALIAQTVIHQLRTRLGEPYCTWEADHFAHDLFFPLEGDVRVRDDTIVVTYYNAPNAARLREHYEKLPHKLAQDGISPVVPWLYGYKLDFRFR